MLHLVLHVTNRRLLLVCAAVASPQGKRRYAEPSTHVTATRACGEPSQGKRKKIKILRTLCVSVVSWLGLLLLYIVFFHPERSISFGPSKQTHRNNVQLLWSIPRGTDSRAIPISKRACQPPHVGLAHSRRYVLRDRANCAEQNLKIIRVMGAANAARLRSCPCRQRLQLPGGRGSTEAA